MNFYRNQKSITLESIFFVHHIFLWCVSKKKIALKKKIRLQNKFDEKKNPVGSTPGIENPPSSSSSSSSSSPAALIVPTIEICGV